MRCGRYSPSVLVTLLLLLLVIGGAAAAASVYVASKRKQLPSSETKALPAGLSERTIRDLHVGDVLTMDGRDFLVEGTITYDEDGHRWVGARIVDGSDVKWTVVGIERVGVMPVRLMVQDTETDVSGFPPEVLMVGELRYALDKRGTATCRLAGDCGALSAGKPKDQPAGAVERCRWWLYNGTGDDTLVLEQWGGEYRMLRGKKVASETIDLIPGS
jgi:hypothetical protein